MSELELVVREGARLRGAKKRFLLATVVNVHGSSYRRPGARMLVDEERWVAGSVSGGCLEGDVLRRGAFRLRSGEPALVTYDSTSEDELGWGVGLGCNGVVDVLLQVVEPDAELDPLRVIGDCITTEKRGVIVTVYRSEDSSASVGAVVAVDAAGCVRARSLPPSLASSALEAEARRALVSAIESCRVEPFSVTAHGVTALVEVVEPPPRLFVCGVAHDAVPLVSLARGMGWRVTVVGAHLGPSARHRFALADELASIPAEDLRGLVPRHAHAFAVVMSHDYERDGACVAALLDTNVRYVGVLGPRKRTDRMLGELTRNGVSFSKASLERLHAPIGLDLGAETPREIALSIVSEIQAVRAAASGGCLRERLTPIHPRIIEMGEAAQ